MLSVMTEEGFFPARTDRGSFRKEIQDPVAQCGTEAQGCQFAHQMLGGRIIVVNAELKSTNSVRTRGCSPAPGVVGSGGLQRRRHPLRSVSGR